VAPEATVIYLHDRDDYDATARRADLDLLREALRDEPDPVTRWHSTAATCWTLAP
jgi:hypothetical protein